MIVSLNKDKTRTLLIFQCDLTHTGGSILSIVVFSCQAAHQTRQVIPQISIDQTAEGRRHVTHLLLCRFPLLLVAPLQVAPVLLQLLLLRLPVQESPLPLLLPLLHHLGQLLLVMRSGRSQLLADARQLLLQIGDPLARDGQARRVYWVSDIHSALKRRSPPVGRRPEAGNCSKLLFLPTPVLTIGVIPVGKSSV